MNHDPPDSQSPIGRALIDCSRCAIGGLAGAIVFLLLHHGYLSANDCIEYVKQVRNLYGAPKGVLEDCMRTGSVQAAVTAIIASLGGGAAAIAVGNAVKEVLDGFQGGGDEEGEGPGDRKILTGTCPHCRAPYPYGSDEDPTIGLCPTCLKPLNEKPPPRTNCPHCGQAISPDLPADATCPACWERLDAPPRASGSCPHCGQVYEFGPNDTERGFCPRCDGDLSVKTRECPSCGNSYIIERGDPEQSYCTFCEGKVWKPKTTEEEPEDTWAQWRKPNCINCGAPLAEQIMTAGARCPACGERNPTLLVGRCPRCQTTINAEAGHCDRCELTFKPPTDTKVPTEDPRDPTKPPETTFKTNECVSCQAPLEGATPDGRCSRCGAKNPTETWTNCPWCGGAVDLSVGACKKCGTRVRDPRDSAGSGDGAATPDAGTSGGGATGAPTLPPDPPMTNQGIISGNRGAEILEQAGLAHVTRDANGNVIKVEEAFPGAFTNLGGQTVTIHGGTVTGPAGPEFQETSKGRVTGIGIEPGTGNVVVVVNHSDPVWEPVAPSTPPTVPPKPDAPTPILDATKEALDKLQKAAEDAKKAVLDQYDGVRGKTNMADLARDGYKLSKGILGQSAADEAVQKLAGEMNIDPAQAKKILEMDDYSWNLIKDTINLPNKLGGGSDG